MHYREATMEDAPRLSELEAALFAGDAWSAELVHSELAAPWTYYLVAEEAPVGIVGYAGVSVVAPGTPADIQTIGLLPEWRRRGIGRELLLQLSAEAVRRGATESLLEVRADNVGAQALYRELGYESIALRPRYYQPDDVDAIIMRAPLPLTQPLTGGAE